MKKNDSAPTRDHYLYFSTISTRWTDNDVYHHVNNALYYNFFDTVIAGYLVSEGGFEFATTDIIGLAVESNCRYRRPLAFPQEIQMGLRVAHLGKSSVRYEVGVFAGDDHQAAADGYFVHVFVLRATNKPTPIPDRLRGAYMGTVYLFLRGANLPLLEIGILSPYKQTTAPVVLLVCRASPGLPVVTCCPGLQCP